MWWSLNSAWVSYVGSTCTPSYSTHLGTVSGSRSAPSGESSNSNWLKICSTMLNTKFFDPQEKHGIIRHNKMIHMIIWMPATRWTLLSTSVHSRPEVRPHMSSLDRAWMLLEISLSLLSSKHGWLACFSWQLPANAADSAWFVPDIASLDSKNVQCSILLNPIDLPSQLLLAYLYWSVSNKFFSTLRCSEIKSTLLVNESQMYVNAVNVYMSFENNISANEQDPWNHPCPLVHPITVFSRNALAGILRPLEAILVVSCLVLGRVWWPPAIVAETWPPEISQNPSWRLRKHRSKNDRSFFWKTWFKPEPLTHLDCLLGTASSNH